MSDTSWDHGKVLDDQSPTPLHYQLRELLRLAIARGDFSEGKLPSERELIKRFGVSRATVREAVAALERDGLIRREHGRGTFIVKGGFVEWLGTLRSYKEIVEEMGYTPGIRLVKQEWVPAPKAVRGFLHAGFVFRLQRLRLADDIPVSVETAYYPEGIGRGLVQHDLTTAIVYDVLEQELGVLLAEAEQTIQVGTAGAHEATLLAIAPGTPLLVIHRRTISIQGTPVEWLESSYRGDLYHYGIRLRRRSRESGP